MDKTYKGKAVMTVKPYGKGKEEKHVLKLEFIAPSIYVAEDMAIEYIHDKYCDAQTYIMHGGLHCTGDDGKIDESINIACQGQRDNDRLLKREVRRAKEYFNDGLYADHYTLEQVYRMRLGETMYKKAIKCGLIN
ncbi:MAG TPA: hypothetical protein PLP33_29470 [Leptospiraceae bacterium]|nr:hypothetical protein [Leptospiraceae bacterium]